MFANESKKASYSNFFGAFVRHHRKTKYPDLTIQEFAERIGVSGPYLTTIELGRVPPPSTEVLEALGRELEIDVTHLKKLAARSDGTLKPIVYTYSRKAIWEPSVLSRIRSEFMDRSGEFISIDTTATELLRFWGEVLIALANASDTYGIDLYRNILQKGPHDIIDAIMYSTDPNIAIIRDSVVKNVTTIKVKEEFS